MIDDLYLGKTFTPTYMVVDNKRFIQTTGKAVMLMDIVLITKGDFFIIYKTRYHGNNEYAYSVRDINGYIENCRDDVMYNDWFNSVKKYDKFTEKECIIFSNPCNEIL